MTIQHSLRQPEPGPTHALQSRVTSNNAKIMLRTLCWIWCFALFINFKHIKTQTAVDDYLEERRLILEAERIRTVGARIALKDDELRANDIIMQLKQKEIDRGFQNSSKMLTSKHFFKYKPLIEKSKLFQIIRKMPKGAALHVHASMTMRPEYMVNLTYTEHLYVCYVHGAIHDLLFSKKIPQQPCPLKWRLMSDLRYGSEDIEGFDKELEKHFAVYNEHEKIETDINTVWARFDYANRVIGRLLAYRPVRERQIYDMLKSFYEDGVLYVEVRSGQRHLYELDGRMHETIEHVRVHQRAAKRFADDHQDFIGMKFILTTFRGSDTDKVRAGLNLARVIKAEMPELFVGFDLVGQEDKGRPLLDFLPVLLEAKGEIDYYFHGGETNWHGMPSDENLVDAILLGSKRIGHAYSLPKHPVLIEAVKSRDIAIEVNVISNNVLALVSDVRNHPLTIYMALGLPVVLSSDDPGVWRADPMSHDFYVAFQCIASVKSDLRTLKQLAINSIRYSSLSNKLKSRAFKLFHRQWHDFIRDVIS